MSRVVVIGTGGTIASVPTPQGASASRSAAQLLDESTIAGHETVTRDVLTIGSYLMTFADMRAVAAAVREALAADDVRGVVVTHGTDTLEESAFLVDLVHHDSRPVVFTGAQRMTSTQGCDGPENLRRSIRLAASPEAAHRGVLVLFGSSVHAARGVRKIQTVDLEAFGQTVGTAMGQVVGNGFRLGPVPMRARPRPQLRPEFDRIRVDLVQHYPGADGALLDAAVAAGARAVVVAGSGLGNANPSMVAAVRRATDVGVVIGLSTRVPFGPVDIVYGNGGGCDMVEAGAIPMGSLPAPQARVLLAVLLAEKGIIDPSEVAPYTGAQEREGASLGR